MFVDSRCASVGLCVAEMFKCRFVCLLAEICKCRFVCFCVVEMCKCKFVCFC